MRKLIIMGTAVLLAACSPKSSFKDYSTPECAARSFVEAGRVGDADSLRESVVAAERHPQLSCDYAEIDDYELALDRYIDDDRAVVMLQLGPVKSPLACKREGSEWKVSIRGSLSCMQEMMREQGAAPR